MFIINKRFEFSASHQLEGLPEGHPCSRVQGHNYAVEVVLQSETLDDTGFVVDFKELKPLKIHLDDTMDHRHLNDMPPFDSVNPTSENIAAYIFDLCRRHVRFEGGTLREVELWETSTDMVRYHERS